MKRWLAVSLLAAAAMPAVRAAVHEEPVDLAMITRIREEGFNNSKVMETAERLTDVLGEEAKTNREGGVVTFVDVETDSYARGGVLMCDKQK
jgi:phenylpyruvate tautomerase PptA (4-oxalocrotonate tautomerase family)